MKNWKKCVYNFSWFLLTVSFFQLFFSITNGIIDQNLFFNTDGLYMPTLYKSLFIDKDPFSSWEFATAPFFFPDFLLFSLVQTAVGNYLVSVITTSLIIFVLIILCLIKLSDYIMDSKNLAARGLLILIASVFVMLVSGNIVYLSTIDLLRPVQHAGQLLMACVFLLLFFEILKKERVYLYPVLFVLTVLTTFSDRSILKDFVAPFFATTLFLVVTDRKITKNIYKFTISLTLGAVLGITLYPKAIPHPQQLVGIIPWWKEGFTSFASSIAQIFTEKTLALHVGGAVREFRNYLIIYIPLILLAVSAAGIMSLKYFVNAVNKNGSNKINKNLLILGLLIIAQFAANLFSVTHFIGFSSLESMRYFSSLFVFPLFWFSLFIIDLLVRHKKSLIVYLYLSLFIVYVFISISFLYKVKPGGIKNFLAYKPANVECVDEIVKKHNLKFGLSNYWNSAPITFFSQEGAIVNKIRLVFFAKDFIIPYYWINSSDWYINNDYSFIVTQNLDKDAIIRDLGDPTKIVQCPKSEILIYNDKKISETIKYRFKAYFMFQRLLKPGDTYKIPAIDFEKYVSGPFVLYGPKIENELVEDKYLSPKEGEGYFSEGPHLSLKRGMKYMITIVYKTSGDQAGYFHIYRSPDKFEKVPFYNTNNKFHSYKYTYTLDKGMSGHMGNIYGVGHLGFFPYYSGNGTLLIDKFIITRIE